MVLAQKQTYRSMKQNREPRINPHFHSQLIFGRGSKHIQWAKDNLFIRKMKLHHRLIPHTRINSKWIKDLNIRPETIKILEENIGSKILDNAHRYFLWDISPQARETKEKINKWDYIKLKSFCTAEETINKII